MTHTLLLADDSVTIQRVIELTFADEDVQVVAVSDGDQAIARLESAPPDIVLADIGMPGKNGYEVAKYVKQSPKLSHIPVVLLTGAFEPVDQARAREVGCDGVLAKPFEPQLVIGRVKELLSSDVAVATVASVSSPEPAPSHASTDLDDYFDRLDVAFSKLSGGKQSSQGTRGPEALEDMRDVTEPPATVADEIDRYVSQHTVEHPVDLSLSPESALHSVAPPPDAETRQPQPAVPSAEKPVVPPVLLSPGSLESPAVPAAPAPRPTAASSGRPAVASFPSVADAFAAILAAEQGEPASATRPGWPIIQAPAAPEPAPLDLTDDQVNRIVGQVLDRMSDRIVRETVAGIATDTAERLVREEIDRIKNAIK